MQLSERALARRYAKALFLSATENAQEAKVNADLGKAYRILFDRLPIFRHPRVCGAEKKELLRQLLADQVCARAVRFLELLIDKKRFDLIVHLAADYASIFDEYRGVATAAVRSATELSERELEMLKTRLNNLSGKKVQLDVKVTPELLAGMVVRMGDWVFDGSLRGQLQSMRRELSGGYQ